MINAYRKYILYFKALFIISSTLFAKENDPEFLIGKVIERFNSIKDYEVDAHIKIDVDFLKVPEADAKIYFKQPAQIKIKSEGFALLPKKGMNFSPQFLFQSNYTSVFVKNENIDGFNTAVLKIIPLADTVDIILSTVWIDTKYYVIRKVESTTKDKGSFTLELFYTQSNMKYPLPGKLIFSFNTKDMKVPRGFHGPSDSEKNKTDTKKSENGKVYITYSNYKVNQGISDKVFEEEEK